VHCSTLNDGENQSPLGSPRKADPAAGGCGGAAHTALDGSLGITAKSSTPPTREVGARSARAEKYQALAQARTWIGRRVNILKPEEQFPGNVFRTFDCRHVRTSHYVGIHHREAFNQAHYSGIATCGSVWACPVCASKIQERRRLELEHLVEWADAQGLQAIMVTLTFPHTSFDTLSELLERQADAFKRFRAGGPFRRLKADIGFQGLVRSLEVTHGANGWHPHTHELWLVDPSVRQDLQHRLIELWQRACVAAGLLDPTDRSKLHAFQLRSVDVRLNATSGEYLAKQDSSRNWGVTHEVAKATSKAGRAKGVHPHEFLIRRAKGDEFRYFEYLEAMKGKRQLFWSPGLKNRCGLDEVADEVIADQEVNETEDLLGNLGSDEWEFIRSRRLVARVLDAAEIGGFALVERFIKLKGYKPPEPVIYPEELEEHRYPGLAPIFRHP
jgi:hypothetical protein